MKYSNLPDNRTITDEGVKLNTIMNYLAGIFYIINIAYAFS